MILRVASFLVPRAGRDEWLAEWRPELAHVRRSRGQRAALRFALGAFPDALWLRRNLPPDTRGLPLPRFARALPRRSSRPPLPSPDSSSCACPRPAFRPVSPPSPPADTASRARPLSRFAQYRNLAARPRYDFTGLAWYQPIHASVQTGPHRAAKLAIALATPNVFDLLDTAVPHTGGNGPVLLLAAAAWRKRFDSDPAVSGRFVHIDGRDVRIAGVLPASAWPLPDAPDAWLLDPDLEAPPDSMGFVLAKLSAPDSHPRRWRIFVPAPKAAGYLECVSLDEESLNFEYFFSMILALLIIRVTTSLPLGEYPAAAPGLRRWIFLTVKLALLLAIVNELSLLARAGAGRGIMVQALLVGFVISIRWALVDQRRRCPVCLRRLTNPTPIGCAAHIFLDWYGAELICLKGHGLLHVPEIVTSSYATQRWHPLDASWSSLFSKI